MKKNVIRVVVILVVVFLLWWIFGTRNTTVVTNPIEENPSEVLGNSEEASSTTVTTFTMDEVRANSTLASCYTVIDGEVYDLGAWISEHPGGEKAILGLCGTDGTGAFEAQHGGQLKPEQTLDGFKIGVLE